MGRGFVFFAVRKIHSTHFGHSVMYNLLTSLTPLLSLFVWCHKLALHFPIDQLANRLIIHYPFADWLIIHYPFVNWLIIHYLFADWLIIHYPFADWLTIHYPFANWLTNHYHFSGIQPDNATSAPPVPDEIPEPQPSPEEAPSQETTTTERLHPDVPSQSEMPLPAGWAMQLALNNRVFFINHNTRTTTWVSEPFYMIFFVISMIIIYQE